MDTTCATVSSTPVPSHPHELIEALAVGYQPKKARSRWVDVAALPPLVHNGHVLDHGHVEAVVAALMQLHTAHAHPVVPLLREHAEPSSLRTFLWQLVDQWQAKRVPGPWVFAMLGLLGDDTLVHELVLRIHEWRQKGNHRRVALALECLNTINSDVALRALNTFAQQEHFNALGRHASAHLDQIAASRQLTRLQLEDRIVPRFGLDDGSTLIEMGTHSFRLILDDELRPALRDQHGRLRRALPRTQKSEACDVTLLALQHWKQLRKRVEQELTAQTARFEQAMVEERRWQVRDWQEAIIDHPLLAALAKRLIWGGYDAGGALQEAFCVSNDGEATNEHYGEAQLAKHCFIGIPHPACVTQQRRLQWGEMLHDFTIMPLIHQLNRPLYTVAPSEGSQTALTSFQSIHLKEGIYRQLYRRGWRNGGYERLDEVPMCYTIRCFGGANTTAIARFVNGAAGGYRTFEVCVETFFIQGLIERFNSKEHDHRLRLEHVSPIVLSETIRDLSDFTSNPKYQHEG